jgi:hypothetical protein
MSQLSQATDVLDSDLNLHAIAEEPSSSAVLSSSLPYYSTSTSSNNYASRRLLDKPRSTAPATPEFSKVYAFIGSLFDPTTTGHIEELQKMSPLNQQIVRALMHNLAINLSSHQYESTQNSEESTAPLSSSFSSLSLPLSPSPPLPESSSSGRPTSIITPAPINTRIQSFLSLGATTPRTPQSSSATSSFNQLMFSSSSSDTMPPSDSLPDPPESAT